MNPMGADPVHLLRDPHDATTIWCSGDGVNLRTSSVGETTCVHCLFTAAEYYGARHEESAKQMQSLMDRQVEVWCSGRLDVPTGDSPR
jgi:hypothetical protein